MKVTQWLVITVGGVGWLLLACWAAGHALIYKRDPRSALGWIAVSLLLPFVGPFFYWVLGINRVQVKARGWQESGRRVVLPREWQREEGAGVSPVEGELGDLRTLGGRVVSTPLLPGNRLTPLRNGEECYPEMLAAIEGSCHTVHLSSYIFDGDGIGLTFAEALRGAARRGVSVLVLVDGLGEKYSHPTIRSRLKDSGVRVERFLPLRQGWYLNLRNHRKLLVVDGVVAFTGGMNIAERHLVTSSSWRQPVTDLHFRVEGPVVADMQKAFLEDWYFATGLLPEGEGLFPDINPAGGALVRAIADGPDREFRKLQALILGACSAAKSRIHIMTPYFIPDRAFLAVLGTAALKGLDVVLVLPEVNNLPLVHWASRAYLWEFLQQGVRVFYQPAPFAHSKLMVVDGLWCLVGSANLDPRSLRLNFEFNLEVYDRNLVSQLEEITSDAMVRGREVTLEEMDGRPLPERLRDGAAKLLSPYL